MQPVDTWWRRPIVWMWVVIAAIAVGMVVRQWLSLDLQGDDTYRPIDPDTWLRLLMVKQWLTTGDWYDHRIVGFNAPFGGSTSPWTRPLDVVLAAFAGVQPESVPLDVRLMRGAALVAPLCIIGMMAAFLCELRRRATDAYAPVRLCGGLLALPLMWNYFGTGNADHHALLSVLWTWSVVVLMADVPRARHAAIAGGLMALGLWISPEVLALLAVFYAWFGLRWLLGGQRAALVDGLVFATVLLAATAVAMMIERPPAQWGMAVYDSISVVQLRPLWLSVCALLVLVMLPARMVRMGLQRALCAVAIIGAAIAVQWAWDPLFFRGPLATAHPFIFTHFLPEINEAKPVWAQGNDIALYYVLLLLAGGAMWRYVQRYYSTMWIAEQAILVLLALVVSAALMAYQARWLYYFMPAVVLVAGIPAAVLTGSLRAGEDAKQHGKLRADVMVFCLLLAVVSTLSGTNERSPITECFNESRRLLQHGVMPWETERSLVVLADSNLAVDVVRHSPHRVVAGNYHRDGAALEYVWQMLRVTSLDALRARLAERRVDVLLICPDIRAGKNSVLMALRTMPAAQLPAWLKPIALPTQLPEDSRPRLLRVVK